MVLRPVRAFVAGRFVQRQIQFVTVCPVLSIEAKDQTCRFERCIRVGAWFAMNRDPTIQYQGAAVFTTAESLTLQYLFQRHVHQDSVQEFAVLNSENGVIPSVRIACKKKPRFRRGFSGLIQ